MKIIIVIIVVLLQTSCAKRTEYGFRQWMSLQIGHPISDNLTKGFIPASEYKDKNGNSYYTFISHNGTVSETDGHVSKFGYYYGTTSSNKLICNIVWIVNDEGNKIDYNSSGNDCEEYDIEYFLDLDQNDKMILRNLVTYPAIDYIGQKNNYLNI